MSFDVFLQGFRDGEAGPVDRQGARRAFADLGLEPDKDGWVRSETPDGGVAEVSDHPSSPDFDGCAFFVRNLTADVANAIWRVAEAGSMVALPAMEPSVVMVTDESQRRHLPPELETDAEVVLVRSASDVLEQLERGHGRWAAYRDQIARDGASAA